MDGWPHSVVSTVARWRLEWRIRRESAVIAREIYPALRENVLRKIASSSANDLAVYARVRAAQLSQECVDSLMKSNPEMSGDFATRLLLKSTELAAESVLATTARARRIAA